MTTVVVGRTQTTEIPYPEVTTSPRDWAGASPFLRTRRQLRFRRGIPIEQQKKIAEAVQVFGMAITIYAPGNGWSRDWLWHPKGDPVVTGEKDGKLYLVAAWK
jgi:hypothetical protein